MNSPHSVSGERPPFARVEVDDDSDDWVLQKYFPSSGVKPIQTSPNGPTVYYEGIPISITECLIDDQAGEQSNFPPPDISSISYNSDGKI